MPLDADAVGAISDVVDAAWTSDDCLLYALSVGAGGADPVDPRELQFTTENSIGIEQHVLPTFALVVPLGPEQTLSALGQLDWSMLVNAEQSLTLHRALPVSGHVQGRSRIDGIYDKGSGALVTIEADAFDATTREAIWTARTSLFIRGAGGWGGDRGPSGAHYGAPARAPDHEVTYRTRPEQALLYRLCGDRNPLHSDPRFARSAGFDRPILHGRCTLGYSGRALLHALCGSDPERFRSVQGRFVAPVIPGDVLGVSIWVTGDGEAAFRTTTREGATALAGRCSFEP
jgi:acyl dehydratase